MQDNINSWEDWKLHYHDELNHIVGYEKRFVDTILQKIPELSHQDVVPQYHFVESVLKIDNLLDSKFCQL